MLSPLDSNPDSYVHHNEIDSAHVPEFRKIIRLRPPIIEIVSDSDSMTDSLFDSKQFSLESTGFEILMPGFIQMGVRLSD